MSAASDPRIHVDVADAFERVLRRLNVANTGRVFDGAALADQRGQVPLAVQRWPLGRCFFAIGHGMKVDGGVG